MDLIQIPLKRTNVVSFTSSLSVYIQQSYAEPPESYIDDLRVLDGLRESSTISFDKLNDYSTLINPFRYYAQLCLLFTKFPPNSNIEFTWGNAFETETKVTQSDLWFERASILFNIGALYSRLGAQDVTSENQGFKKAFNQFQMSAGVFNLLKEKVIPECRNELTQEMSTLIVSVLENLMIAQAQECTFRKVINDKMKDVNVAKVAKGVSELYQVCLDSVRNNSIKQGLLVGWEDEFIFKVGYFEAVSHYRMACDRLSSGKYGEEIACLQVASSCLQKLYEFTKKTSWWNKKLNPVFIEGYEKLNKTVEDNLARSVRDNDLIYLDLVPDAADLPPIPAFKMARATIPGILENPGLFIDKEELGAPLFRALVPLVVHQAASLYEDRKEQYVKSGIIQPLDALALECEKVILSLNVVETLDAVEKPVGVPPHILFGSEQVKSEGGFFSLQQLKMQMDSIRQKIIDLLKEAESSLDNELKSDQNLRLAYGRNQMNLNRPQSAELTVSNRSLILQYQSALKKASDNDVSVYRRITDWEPFIRLLESGPEKIMLALPSSNSSGMMNDPHSRAVIDRLRQYLSEVEEMKKSRAEKIQDLSQRMASDDISSELVQEVDQIYFKAKSPFVKIELDHFESLFEDRLSVYNEWKQYLSSEQEKQTELLDNLREANLAFISARRSNPFVSKRESALANLQTAIERFNDISKTLREGLVFYSNMMEGVLELRNNCVDFGLARNMQAQDLMPISNSTNESSQQNQQRSSTSPSIVAGTWDPSKPLQYNTPRRR
ncbi:hypothetical protein BB558_001806 [Smittium angustum]|uniref:BRO1 domain-containing protein n=1 Tax=Smittium angustum TaxID=133377 RepID=A0A2U1JAK9_SMIAN|nr:hypothetical protein BB558_001806 [Smittium angustum]